ncbi:hypothetical protein Javan253_0030 [Streptococcus phage Javan253]|uniref:DUF1642 domain-containing protein n=1 Tax=Streptococcus henryi TaxID=439219 RepID=UPI00037DB489|nr:DUF1642 domain-containing protein [Streptococcus henryi]QBX16486.1 hypothetical protein Javan253_0030 [Streptococcus phage Javan253]
MNNRELFKKISDLDEITVHIPTKSELTSLNGVASSRMNLRPINYLRKSEVLELVEQLDEPKKPVIPKFVAEYIESELYSCSTLSEAIDDMDDESQILNWFYYNSELFARAWLAGYEVEKEKLYTVEIPNPNAKYSRIVLQRLRENALHLKEYTGEDWKGYMMNQLTEAEIKQDFEWAWQWAKPVEAML